LRRRERAPRCDRARVVHGASEYTRSGGLRPHWRQPLGVGRLHAADVLSLGADAPPDAGEELLLAAVQAREEALANIGAVRLACLFEAPAPRRRKHQLEPTAVARSSLARHQALSAEAVGETREAARAHQYRSGQLTHA